MEAGKRKWEWEKKKIEKKILESLRISLTPSKSLGVSPRREIIEPHNWKLQIMHKK